MEVARLNAAGLKAPEGDLEQQMFCPNGGICQIGITTTHVPLHKFGEGAWWIGGLVPENMWKQFGNYESWRHKMVAAN